MGSTQVLADGLERAQRSDLVGAHQPAVADDVGRQDRGELALNVLVLCQAERPSINRFPPRLADPMRDFCTGATIIVVVRSAWHGDGKRMQQYRDFVAMCARKEVETGIPWLIIPKSRAASSAISSL